MKLTGKVSWFGGSKDTGVRPDERLALYPTASARELDRPLYDPFYCAMRWNYTKIQAILKTTQEDTLAAIRSAIIRVRFGQREVTVIPVDWGPNEKTGRLIEVSPATMKALGCDIDDVVEIELPDWLELQ